MTNSWKIGGVQLQLNEDGTFLIYQPDSNRVLPKELAAEVAHAILEALPFDLIALPPEALGLPADAGQSTVGGGVIGTSEGPVNPGLTDTEREADKNAAEARASIARGVADVEAGRVTPVPSRRERSESPATTTPVKRGPGRPRKRS